MECLCLSGSSYRSGRKPCGSRSFTVPSQSKLRCGESRFRLPLRIDTDAFVVTGTGIVFDANNKFVAEYDTLDDAEVFVAKANGVDVATLKRSMEDSAKMHHEYLRRLKKGKRE